ncbi:MAG: NUDIX domain-containing protein [Ruminococcus sp.]
MRRTKDDKGRTLEEFLKAYSPKDYPRPSVTVDMVLFSIKENNISVLLIKRGGHPYLDYWALPGGFTESKETVYESAERELFEETNLKDIPLEELGVFSEPSRDPRSWTMTDAFFAVVDRDKIAPKAGDDARDVLWFDIEINCHNNLVELRLKSDLDNINIILEKNIKKGVTGDYSLFKTIENGGIAFDHGEIIAKALDKMNYLK